MCRGLPLNHSMDIYEIRRARLQALIAQRCAGNQATLSSKTGIKAPQINRWLSSGTKDPRRITETSARNIEHKMGLPSGWMDQIDDYLSINMAREPDSMAYQANMARIAAVVEIMKSVSAAGQERILGAALLVKSELGQ